MTTPVTTLVATPDPDNEPCCNEHGFRETWCDHPVSYIPTWVQPAPAGFVWENPPAAPTGKYAAHASQLRANPGRWAVIDAMSSTDNKRAWGLVNNLHIGKYVDFRATDGHFEACARTSGLQTKVYARFVPAATYGSHGQARP